MLSPAETVSVAAPASAAAARSASSTTARRDAPPLSVPVPATVGAGKSSSSGLSPSRCECSSLLWSNVSCRGGEVGVVEDELQAQSNTAVAMAVRRSMGPLLQKQGAQDHPGPFPV